MGYITRKDLETYYKSRVNREGFGEIKKFIHRRKKYSFEELEEQKLISVYLSHCQKDHDLIVKAIVFLSLQGANIYVDWKNHFNANDPFANKKLKEKILDNKKFILLASNEALNSSWLVWELGFADPYKFIRNMAIFPIADEGGNWPGADHLLPYPTIEKKVEKEEVSSFVNFGGGHSMNLIDWLHE